MKLYEEILFQSLLERFRIAIQMSILIIFGVSEVYSLKTLNLLPIFICIITYPLWFSFFQKQSLVIGSKNIVIGQKFFPYDFVSSLSIEKKGLVIEVKGKSLTIYNWALGKRRESLEKIVNEIGEVIVL